MQIYVKSFEDDFVLKRLVGKKKKPFQSIDNVLKTKKLKPNTASFGKKYRLACSVLHKNYLKTYRSQGLIFATKTKPNEILPFDIVLCTDAKKIVVHYYRIKDNLHQFYNRKLINGFEQFIFKDFSKLVKNYPTTKKVWAAINKFRKGADYGALPKQKFRLVQYNEAIFTKTFTIKPLAVFGYKPLARKIAKKYTLPHYRTAKEFYLKNKNLFYE